MVALLVGVQPTGFLYGQLYIFVGKLYIADPDDPMYQAGLEPALVAPVSTSRSSASASPTTSTEPQVAAPGERLSFRRLAFFFLAPLVAVLFPAVRAFAARVMVFPAFLTVLGSRLATSCFAFFAAALTPVSARLQACLSRHVSHLIDNRFFFGIDNVRPSHSSGVERAARRLVPIAAGCERLRMVRKL